MEHDRVLAYTLAKEIDNKDLLEVSGGAADATMKAKPSFQPSAHSMQGMDVSFDMSVDW